MKILDPQLLRIKNNFKQIPISARVWVCFVFVFLILNLSPRFKFLNWLSHHNFPVEFILILRAVHWHLPIVLWESQMFILFFPKEVNIPKWKVSDYLELVPDSGQRRWVGRGMILYYRVCFESSLIGRYRIQTNSQSALNLPESLIWHLPVST